MNEKGIIITLTLVFGTIFLIMLAGLLGFILLIYRQSLQKAAWNDSLHIAEAGANYYRWHLNQTPLDQNPDIQDGNSWCCKVSGVEYGQDAPQCQQGDFAVCGTCDGNPCYEHDYYDPEAKKVGKFVLEIKGKKICGETLGVYINSTGFTDKFPNVKRKIEVKFAATSIAEYGSIIDEAVWRAEEEKTYGRFHTNKGMHMDAISNSLVTTAAAKWECTYSYDCQAGSCPEGCVDKPNGNCDCNGICGSGGPKDLWAYPPSDPITEFPFGELTYDLTKMKKLANEKGKYYPSSKEKDSNGKGYLIILNGDGTYDIKIVTGISGIPSAYDLLADYLGEYPWITSYEVITSYSDKWRQENVTLPACCGLIFVEDNLWIEGKTQGKITVASANFTPNTDTTIFIKGNLDYTTLDGSDSLALIADGNILITRGCQDNESQIILRGVFVAQDGYFGRRGYKKGPASERIRDKLINYGTIVSKIRGEVTYLSGETMDTIFSGFKEWDTYFDAKLARDPPPLLPYVSEELEIISWEEIQ